MSRKVLLVRVCSGDAAPRRYLTTSGSSYCRTRTLPVPQARWGSPSPVSSQCCGN
jgi:hypothetical protein